MSVASLHLDKALTGTSSDTKPTSIAQGTLFYETDTGAWFVNDGSAWVSYTSSAKQSPADIMLTAEGLISQNFDRQTSSGRTLMIDGTIYFMLVPLRAGQLISNISIVVATAAVTMSIGKVALYDSSGNLKASSASQTTAWESQGVKTVALSAAYTVPTTGGYYAAVFAKASTLPQLARGYADASITNRAIGSGVRAFASQTGQTDLTDPATLGDSSLAFWVGIS